MESYVNIRLAGIDDDLWMLIPPKMVQFFVLVLKNAHMIPVGCGRGEGLSERSNFEKQMAPDQSVCDSLFA